MQLIYCSDSLEHHGVKGQKWGVRRYQNADGSLTSAGKKRYGVSSLSKKGVRIANSADRYIYNIEKQRSKTAMRRNKVREKIAKKYDKKINKLSENPEQHSDSIKALTKEKAERINNHKKLDKYVNAGYKQCMDTVSNYRNVKLKALNNKDFKQTMEYKNAITFYNRQVRMQSMNYGNLNAVALNNAIRAYNKRSISK